MNRIFSHTDFFFLKNIIKKKRKIVLDASEIKEEGIISKCNIVAEGDKDAQIYIEITLDNGDKMENLSPIYTFYHFIYKDTGEPVGFEPLNVDVV